MSAPHDRPPQFPTTRWSLIENLRDTDAKLARRALDEICALYHYPLYCYARRHGLSHHDAEDALQDFFAKLLRNESFQAADAAKGNLRRYLTTALRNHLVDWHHAKNREASQYHIPIPEFFNHRYTLESTQDNLNPEQSLDRQWARELLSRVLATLENEYSNKHKGQIFTTLHPVLLDGGSLRGHNTRQLAHTLGMTEGALRVTLSRLLRDYKRLLELEILQTVHNRDEVADEIRHLMCGFQPGACRT